MSSTPRPLSLFALLALLATLALLLAPTGAPARSSHARRSSCPASAGTSGKRSRHAAARHACSKRQSRKAGKGSRGHAQRKAVRRPAAPVVTLAPAGCEDGSLPSGSAGGSFSCADGSEPACADGSAPTRTAASGAPMCVVESPESGQRDCAEEGGDECPTIEFACQDARESGDSECPSGGGEEAAQEPEDQAAAQPPHSLSAAPATRS